MDKMQKYSKWALTFLTIWKWIVVITMVAVTLFVIVFLAGGVRSDVTTSITLDYLKFTLAPGKAELIPSSLLWLQLLFVLMCFFTLYIISMLRKIFKPMAAGLPFDCQVGPAIRKIAWVQLIGNVISQILSIATGMFSYFAYDFPTLFLNDSIIDCRMELNFKLDFLIVFFILMLLSCIFEYGQELQQLSDETL